MGLGKDHEADLFAPLVPVGTSASEHQLIEQVWHDQLLKACMVPSGYLGSQLIKVEPEPEPSLTDVFYSIHRTLAVPAPDYGISLTDLTGAFQFFDPPPRIPPRVGRRDWAAANPWPKDEE